MSFTHDQEIAFPGYYAVLLPKPGVVAELTTRLRVGLHRYPFAANLNDHCRRRTCPAKRLQHFGKKIRRNRWNGCHAQSSRLPVVGDLRFCVFDQRQNLSRSHLKQLARIRQGQTARLTFKQRLPQLFLKLLNRTTERRLRNHQILSSPRKIASFGNLQKISQLMKFHETIPLQNWQRSPSVIKLPELCIKCMNPI